MKANVVGYAFFTAIVIGIVAAGLHFSETTISTFVSYPPYMFLSEKDVVEFIRGDADRYIANLSPLDLAARGVGTPQRYVDKAVKAADEFSAGEKRRLIAAGKAADLRIINTSHTSSINGFDAYKATYIPWCFAKTAGRTYEDGMPHTRLDVIFLPETIVTPDSDEEYLVDTLIHEKIHIYQRRYPEDIFKFIQANKFIQWKKRADDPLARANPDLDPYIYISGREPMIAQYNSDSPADISDVTIYPINKPDYEHPYELMAYQIVKTTHL